MSWGLVAGAAVTAGSAALSSSAANKARNSQEAASMAALAEQQRQFDLMRADQAPYRETGRDALGRLAGLQDYDPTPHALAVQSEPGYQFGLDQGRNALEGSAAAGGGLYSGSALKALTRYGNDYGTTKYNDAFNRSQTAFGNKWNRLSGLAGIGQTANQQSQTAGMNLANNASGIMTNLGQAQGGAAMAQGSIWGNALGQIAGQANKGSLQGRFSNTDWGRSGFGTGLAYGNEDMGQYLAEGGRVEPRVGTRSPLPQGAGGGGLSADAIRRALDEAHAAGQQQQPSGVGALPADPLRNPGAILQQRMQRANFAAGGPVHGEAPGRADDVPAMLSAGEHVIDAETVALLGEGNSEAGHALLEELKERVRAHALTRKPGASDGGAG
jgi:hypothetical protein